MMHAGGLAELDARGKSDSLCYYNLTDLLDKGKWASGILCIDLSPVHLPLGLLLVNPHCNSVSSTARSTHKYGLAEDKCPLLIRTTVVCQCRRPSALCPEDFIGACQC